jgi:transcription initiation factor TFIIF subunit beta
MSSEEHQAALARAEAALEEHERSATRFDLEILRPGKHELDENQLVIGNRPKLKEDGTPSRARESFRKGKIKHTCAMQPYMDARYRKIIRDRAQLANMPKRRIIQVNAEDMNATAEVNNLPSMAEVNAGWQPRASKAPVKKGEFERYARMPKNELLDKLFALFQEEKPYWPLKELRLRTQQPEGYLKEVVTSIAILHRNGEHVGKYSLKPEHLNAAGPDPNFFKAETSSSALADGMDEDDDDDDMEEVS